MDREVVKAVRCEEPTDENYGGWDILISVPFKDGSPGWACVAEIKSDTGKDVIVNVLETVDLVMRQSAEGY